MINLQLIVNFAEIRYTYYPVGIYHRILFIPGTREWDLKNFYFYLAPHKGLFCGNYVPMKLKEL